MVDPVMVSSNNKPIFFIDLSGQNSIPVIPDSFISNHLKSITQSTKLKLTSDASDRAWEVELDGHRFAHGWKHFSVHHGVRNDDVLSFRHDGDMVFHVTPFGRSFSQQIQFISSTSEDENARSNDVDDDEHNIFDDDVYDEDDEHADAGDDDNEDDSRSEEELNLNKALSKKRAESPSENSYLLAHVTSSTLNRNHIGLPNKFARPNGLSNRQCEIDLLNEDAKSWTLELRHNKTTGQAYMCRGWTSFCKENGFEAGSSCRFKLVQTGPKPVLQLCLNTSTNILPQGNSSKARDVPENIPETVDFPETAQMNQNRTMVLEFKPYMLKTGQLHIPAFFSRENGINEAGEVTIVNKHGVEWKLHLASIKRRGQFYIRGVKACFVANGIKKVGDSFTLDVIRGGTSPIFKICSKIKETAFDGNQTTKRRRSRLIQASQGEEEMETCVQKKARVSTEGGSSRRTRASNKLSVGPANLQHKKPLEACSISDQVSKVRQSIVHTLTDVRQFRSELEMKEKNLETSLLEIDALGEKIQGISNFFNVNQV